MFGPVVEGERVRLIPPSCELIPLYLRWFADMEVTRYLTPRMPPSEQMEEEWLDRAARSGDSVLWAIEVAGSAIGSIGIHEIDWRNRHATTGIVIGERSEWGKGYATEAMSLRTRFAFGELNLNKLSTRVFLENEASWRALMKAGYRQVGIARQENYRLGRWHDMWLGEVLREDWEARST